MSDVDTVAHSNYVASETYENSTAPSECFRKKALVLRRWCANKTSTALGNTASISDFSKALDARAKPGNMV